MAGTTGLEPAASAVTGQRSNQLNYVPTRQINEIRNRRISATSRGLPELPNPLKTTQIISNRGDR
jgi:hypothetical protein